MSDSPGQILCTVANDYRLIVAGAAAVSSHAARRAGLERDEQEEIADAAIEVCRKAFASAPIKGAGSSNPPSSLRIGVSELPDCIEVTLGPADGKARAATTLVETSLRRPLAQQVRYEAGEGYFRVTVARLCGTQNSKSTAGDSPARR